MQSIVNNGMLILLGLVLAVGLGATAHFYSSHHGTVIVNVNVAGFEQFRDDYDAYLTVTAISRYDRPLFLKSIQLAGSFGCFNSNPSGGVMTIITPRIRWAGASVSVNNITDSMELQSALRNNDIVLNPGKSLNIIIHIHTSCPQVHEGSIILNFVDSSGHKYTFVSDPFEVFP